MTTFHIWSMRFPEEACYFLDIESSITYENKIVSMKQNIVSTILEVQAIHK